METEELLQTHIRLRKILIKIPAERKITYREEIVEGNLIGKPRFEPELYEWNPELFATLRDHLQEIWNYFELNSYWFDEELKKVLLFRDRRLSKKSVIFLLERDVWETDEVYGEYLIEEGEKTTEISYYRFGYKFKTFKVDKLDTSEREEWIIYDAVRQIQIQLERLWNRLEMEIYTCQEESHNRPIPVILSDEDLKNQYSLCDNLLETSKAAALLVLGRLQELWILKSLDRERTKKGENLFFLAEKAGVVNKSNKKFFLEIRTHYNMLKHTTTYNIENCDLERLIKQFGQYLHT